MSALKLLAAVALLIPIAAGVEPKPGASSWFPAHQILQPPANLRGNAMATVIFGDQKIIDGYCSGQNALIACAGVKDHWIVLPNPCQPRFAGESYAALVCHEKGHNLGWSHLHGVDPVGGR